VLLYVVNMYSVHSIDVYHKGDRVRHTGVLSCTPGYKLNMKRSLEQAVKNRHEHFWGPTPKFWFIYIYYVLRPFLGCRREIGCTVLSWTVAGNRRCVIWLIFLDWCRPHIAQGYLFDDFYVLLTVRPGTMLGKWPTWCTITLYKTFIIIILYFFYVLLTVHLSIIIVIKQPNAQILLL